MPMLSADFMLDGRNLVRVPAAFFSQLGYARFADLMAKRDGVTSPDETRCIWQLLKRADKPPRHVRLVFKTDDAVRAHPGPPTGSIATALEQLWRLLIEH